MGDGAGGLPSLADTIAAVRRELSSALAAGQGQPARFRAGPVELELEIAVTCTGGGQAGVHLSVLTLRGQSALARATTQRIKVTLQPLDPDTGENASQSPAGTGLESRVLSSAGGGLPERPVRAEGPARWNWRPAGPPGRARRPGHAARSWRSPGRKTGAAASPRQCLGR